MNIQLKRLRKLSGLSQQEVADSLNVKIRTYGSWERGEVSMSLKQAYDCAVLLRCTLDELCGRKVNHVYSDARQSSLNASYENMNDAGKSTLTAVARSMEKDTANRIVKDGQECLGGEAASG